MSAPRSRSAGLLAALVLAAALAVGHDAHAGAPAVATPAAAPAPGDALTLETLMHHFATTNGVREEFREVKEIAILDAPLVSEGVLYFVPPRRFARFTTRPGSSSFVIDGDHLAFRDETGGDTVDLSSNRVARAIVDNMIGLWSGDLAALRDQYEVGFETDGPRWRIRLRPLHATVDKLIAHIVLEGEGAQLSRMELLETGGDRTVTTFHDTQVDRRFTPAEMARIFPRYGAAPRP